MKTITIKTLKKELLVIEIPEETYYEVFKLCVRQDFNYKTSIE